MKEIEELGYTVSEVKAMYKSSNNFKDFCYHLVKLCGDNKQKIKEIALLINSTEEEIIKKAQSYKNEDHINYKDKEKKEEKKKMYINNGYNKKFNDFIKALLNTDDKDIIAFFSDSRNYQISKDKDGINKYLINMDPDNMKIVRDKIQIYRDYLLNLKKNENKQKIAEYANNIIENVMLNYDLKTFTELFANYSFGGTNISKIINYWKTHEDEKGVNLYEKLAKHLSENRYNYYHDHFFQDIQKILALTTMPIKVGEKYRNLDTLDCYTYFRYPFGKISQLLSTYFTFDNTLENQERVQQVAILKSLLFPQNRIFNNLKVNLDACLLQEVPETLREITIQRILEKKIYSPITNELFDDDDKRNIINEMDKNDIPVTMDAFLLVINKYYNNHLELITKENIDNYLEKGKIK